MNVGMTISKSSSFYLDINFGFQDKIIDMHFRFSLG